MSKCSEPNSLHSDVGSCKHGRGRSRDGQSRKSINEIVRKKGYEGKRKVLREERNEAKDVEQRRLGGREFQRVGAAKEKERRPEQEFIFGIDRKRALEDLSRLVGLYGWRRSFRYEGELKARVL